MTQNKQPDLTSTTTLVTKNQFTYTDSLLASAVQKTSYLNSASSTNSYTYLDGFGRTIQTRSQAKGNNTYAVKDNVYNTRGLLAQESLPYFASSTARSTATSTPALFSTYTYDPLSRVTQITNAVGTTTNSYLNWKVTTTDANSKQKDLFKDAFDNLITVVEHIATTTATTSYAWNGNGYLTSITDASGNLRNFTYDGMGRRLTAEDLHASGDTSFGTWTYSYDDANNQTQTLDPKSQTVNFTYDALNRPLTEDYTGQAGTEVTYTYDSCTYGKSRLCTASSTAALTNYAYDPLGAEASETMTITGTTTSFATTYTNDRQGNQTQIIYPDASQVSYVYNAAGLIDAIQEKESGAATTTVIRSFDYSPQSLPTVIVYGNGATTTNTYNASALYRLSNKVTALPGGGSHAQDLAYTDDALGNITQITDNSNSATAKTTNYTYDDLSRLLTASTTNATTSPNYQQTYSYNALGNITTGPLGTYLYTGNTGSNYANPHAVTAITVSTTTTTTGGTATSTIALDATSTSITTGFNGTVTKTWTHTVTGSSTVLVLSADLWQDVAGSGSVSSASWNGGSFTKIATTRSVNMESEEWYYVPTTTGSHTMSVTISGNTDAIKLEVASFTGVSPYNTVDASSTATGTSGNPTISATTATSSDLLVATLSRFSTTNATTNRTSLYNDHVTSTLGAASYQQAGAAGSYSDTYTGSAAQDWSMVMAGLKVATSSTSGGTATTTSTTTLTYDNNGNLTGDGTYTYTWDYRNQLTQTATGTATTTYAYGHQGNRVKLTEAGVTTYFPNPLYNTNAATTTKHIYAGNLLVATVENASSTSSSGGGGSTSTSTPTFVQDGIDTDSSSVVLGSPVTTGDLIVVGITTFGQSVPSNTVTDNKGNTYTKVTEAINNSNGGDHVALFYAKNVTGGSSFTVSTGITGRTLAVHEYSGVATSSPFDKVASSTGTSNTPNSGNVTTATSSELYFGVAWSAGDGDSWTAGSGYTTRESQTNNATAERLGSEDATISSASTTAAKFTTTTSQPWAIILATFQPSVTSTSTATTTTASSTIRYVHTDQINGSNIVTDTNGNLVETLDYYPYGATRLDTKAGSYVGEKRKFAGTEYDVSSGLNYMQARYQNPTRGAFISEDPMSLGDPKSQVLTDPQSLNSYSYAEDNPISKSDPGGKATYIWANGAGMEGIDTWNTHTFYQTADNAMLLADAGRVQAQGPIGGLYNFTASNWFGSTWDYKSRANPSAGGREFYFFGNELVNADTYGNYHYGYVGAAAGYPPFLLQSGAGFVQVLKAIGKLQVPNLNWASSYFNNPTNPPKIQNGINSYNSGVINDVISFGSPNIQTRVAAVNSFNSGAGATSNESKLWTTPNGAVVTWLGTPVSGGIK